MNTADTPAPAPARTRKKALIWLAVVVIVCGVAFLLYWLLYSRTHLSTDDAYVGGDLVQITPLTGGTVVAINADNTDLVRAGQPVVRLDPTDATLALERAATQLAQAVRSTRGQTFSADAAAAEVALRAAQLKEAQGNLARRQKLAGTEAVTAEELANTRDAVADAENLLRLDELVCNDTYDCRHENGNDALHGIEDTDFRSESDAVEVADALVLGLRVRDLVLRLVALGLVILGVERCDRLTGRDLVVLLDEHALEAGRDLGADLDRVDRLDCACRRDRRLHIHADDLRRLDSGGLLGGLLPLIVAVAAKGAACEDERCDGELDFPVYLHFVTSPSARSWMTCADASLAAALGSLAAASAAFLASPFVSLSGLAFSSSGK